MFCPACGAEDTQNSQYCRSCGTSIRQVRILLERPDSVTESAVGAREEIGKAIAGRIQQLNTARELKQVVENVLPEVEKFLESPEERRLRTIRNGVITAAVGLALFIVMTYLAPQYRFLPSFALPGGVVALLVGLGMVINGLLFTVPRRNLPRVGKYDTGRLTQTTGALQQPSPPIGGYFAPPSVTEHTTRQLPEDPLKVPLKRQSENS